MQLDLSTLPYRSTRQPLFATRGVVATSQPLAAQAGLAMLQRGGNAVDAAIATAVALTVVEPTSNGIGGDLFALVWDGARLHGLNGSGRAPAALTMEAVRAAGHASIPARGWLSVTVPGAPAGWRDLHQRFGQLRFTQLFEPAISYAEQGFPVSPVLAQYWERAAALFATSRFNAFVIAAAAGSKEQMIAEKEAAIAYFMDQYEKMLRENIDEHLTRFDQTGA